MSKPKKVFTKILKITAILLTILIILFAILFLTQKPKNLSITDVDLTAIKNGLYTGSVDNGLVKATVSVEINNGEILNITILEHDNMLGKPAERIIDNIVEQQSLDVDTIASATYSSDTLRKAVENALRQGE